MRPTLRMFVVLSVLKGIWHRKRQGFIRINRAISRRTRKSRLTAYLSSFADYFKCKLVCNPIYMRAVYRVITKRTSPELLKYSVTFFRLLHALQSLSILHTVYWINCNTGCKNLQQTAPKCFAKTYVCFIYIQNWWRETFLLPIKRFSQLVFRLRNLY